jgi:uncharacterized protein (UPF0332 family)
VEAAVHRDLVKTGRWTKELGTIYSDLHMLRTASDYDLASLSSEEDVKVAVKNAEKIVEAVRATCPALDAK